MGKLKKDISSSVYLQFVNKIWKNTSTCCTCTIRNGECVIIAQKGKVDAVLEDYAMDPETSLSILYNLLASADIMAESFYVK